LPKSGVPCLNDFRIMKNVTRRTFLRNSAAAAAGSVVASELGSRLFAAENEPSGFGSQWQTQFDRIWVGPEYWANPMQDWRIAGGRLECVKTAPDRTVHLLTHQLAGRSGDLRMSVRIGRVGNEQIKNGKGSAGFRIGILGPLEDYRNSLIFGTGLDTGITATGGLFIGDIAGARAGTIDLARVEIELRLNIQAAGDTHTVTLSAHDTADGSQLGEIVRRNIPPARLVGNIALACNFPPAQQQGNERERNNRNADAGQFWFSKWRVSGSKVDTHPDQAFGPILFSQYTLSGGILKMTAQMPPLGEKDAQTVQLQIGTVQTGAWFTIAESPIHQEARTATFRIENWNDQRDVPYRLAYGARSTDSSVHPHYWTGTVRRDPVDQPVLTVADVSCNFHSAFPNAPYVRNMETLNPDFLAFVGDQFYEPSGGYGITRAPLETAIIDYHRKWAMHGWTWRELTRNRPSISLPDDHDVYQGNIWGESGAPRTGTQEMGGYDMFAAWVNVVHRTQTSHLPDPHDPSPIGQNILVYHGALTYGGVSFAVLADRMFKSGPEGKVPPTGDRGDHVKDPNFDPRTADVEGVELLGERQMKFLGDWVSDWRGARMKAVLSQTIFTAMATTHGGNRERLIADYDTNGWPQQSRNEALRLIRKAFAVHIAGDQHLPAVVHYGIDEHRDGPIAFAGPAVNVGYPRWWEPAQPGRNRAPGDSELTGDFTDSFGHPLTVMAVANGAIKPSGTILERLQQKASGLGVVRFDKPKRKITIECWPFLADPSKEGTQFPGWPVTFSMTDNYARKPSAWLPIFQVSGLADPLIEVIQESNGDLVYAQRIPGNSHQPGVFEAGNYTVRFSEPETGKSKEIKGIRAGEKTGEKIQVTF
jgi:alkaline phosphatase D